MYRSPLRDADDRTYAHLWENAWVLDAPGQAHTIIWLHGLGQDTSSLHTMADILSPPRTKFVVPQAPKMPITALPDAPEQRNWFDIIVEHRDAIKEKEGEMMEEDEVGIEEVRATITAAM
jgi:predicted esterase